jgi:NADPH:quinone reductase-like Zn-dependent oxidoreductase
MTASRGGGAAGVVAQGGGDLLFDGAGGQTRDQALDAVRDGGRALSIVLQGTPLHWTGASPANHSLPTAAAAA